MSNWSEERRADRALGAEQAREDRRLLLEAQLKAKEIDAEQQRLDREAKEERDRRADAEQRRIKREEQRQRESKKTQRKAARGLKRARQMRWLQTHPADIAVAVVMVASIIPAVLSQVRALGDADVMMFLAMLLATMLEGASWAMNFMAQAAEKAGKPTGKFRAAGWFFAAIAAVVNFWHWSDKGPLWVALVFGASSLVAYTVWDLRQHGTNGKTKAERRAEKERRAEEKARKAHLDSRRKDHKDIAREADRLLSALPFGEITEEEAFAAAWRVHRGAEPGLSAELYAAATQARVQLGAAFELGEHVRPELLRNGLMAGILSPLPNAFPTLGPVSPLPALAGGQEGPGSQAGLGLYALDTASEEGAENKAPATPAGRSDEELEALRPRALRVAAELVAEGNRISATQLQKKLQIRREDAAKLRDWVVADRREQYGVAAASDGTNRKSVTARIDK